mgnify:FL=1
MTTRCRYTDMWTQPKGDPCPETHCQANCGRHTGGMLTCPECITEARDHLTRIVEAAALMLPEAIHRGVNSEAANLAGPAPHPGTARARWQQGRARASTEAWVSGEFDPDVFNRAIDRLPDDDPAHPYAVLGRWHMMLAEDYQHEIHDDISVAGSAGYLNRTMHRLAHDPYQDFPIFLRDIRHCRRHLDAVLRANAQIERGAPCHLCGEGDFVKHYTEAMGSYGRKDRAGYLLDDQGQRIPADEWRCNRCAATLSDEGYRRVVEASYVATADRLTISELARRTSIPLGTLQRWASGEWKRGQWVDPRLTPVGSNRSGRKLYLVAHAEALRDGQNGLGSGMVSVEGVV